MYIMYLKVVTGCAFYTKVIITLPSSAHVLYNVCNNIHSTLCGSLNQQKPNPKRHSQRLNYRMDKFQGGYTNRPTVASQLRQYELITAQFKQQLAQITSAKTNYCLYMHLGTRRTISFSTHCICNVLLGSLFAPNSHYTCFVWLKGAMKIPSCCLAWIQGLYFLNRQHDWKMWTKQVAFNLRELPRQGLKSMALLAVRHAD